MAYPFGQAVRLSTGTIIGDSGPTNPATLILTVTLPDTTTAVFNLAAFTQDSTGLYHLDYLPTLAGIHNWRIVATNPNTAAEGTFSVDAVGAHFADPVSREYVKAHLNMSAITVDDAELQTVIASAVGILEDLVGPIIPRTFVDTFDGGSKQIVLRNPPIISLTSVTERLGFTTYTDTPDSPGTYGLYGYQLDDGGVITKHMSSWTVPFFRGDRNVTVTYQAGRVSLTPKLQLAVAELVRHLWQTQQGSRSRQAQPNDYVAPAPGATTRFAMELIGLDTKLPGIG